MATPTVKAITTAQIGSGTSLPIVLPDAGAGAAAGDFALLYATLTPSIITDPGGGWAPLPGTPTTPTSANGKAYVWSKTLASGDLGATVNLAIAASSRAAAACLVTSPAEIDASATDETNTAGTSVVAPSVDPSVADALLAVMHGVIGNAAADQPTWTADAATTERADVVSGSVTLRNATLLLATQALVSGDPTGTRTATASLSVQRQGISIALKAALSSVTPDGVAVSVAAGNPTVQQTLAVSPTGLSVGVVPAAPTVVGPVRPDGLLVPVALGAPVIGTGFDPVIHRPDTSMITRPDTSVITRSDTSVITRP